MMMMMMIPVSTGIFPHSLPEWALGQDLGFGGFAFALKLPELLNINLLTVRAKLEAVHKVRHATFGQF